MVQNLRVPYADQKSFIAALRSAGELVEIREPVSTDLEIACAAHVVSRLPGGGPALLFSNVTGHKVPVLINALGSEKRLSMVCGVRDFEGLRTRLQGLLEQLQTPRKSLIDKLKTLPMLKELSGFFPTYVKRGACHEVVQTGDAVDLSTVPVLKTWPEDGGPFITFPLVFTHSPKDGKRNCGMYRLQIYDKRTTGFHVHTHHTAAEHMREAKRAGKNRLEAAVAIGGAPVITFAAVLPLPPGLDEMILAGFLQGSPVQMVQCKTVNLQVPASADFVIEGYVEIDEKRREGPFGDHTGFYSLADDYPTFHVTAITRRRDPVYFTTVVGPPPQEDCWMGRAIERLFLPLMQQPIPEVLDYRLPYAGVFHNLMLVKIRKSYPGQARKVAHAVWGLGQAMFTKVICVMDETGPDVRDEAAVAKFLIENVDVARDLEFVLGPTETLDHATRALHFGSKLAIDATRKFPGEETASIGTPVSDGSYAVRADGGCVFAGTRGSVSADRVDLAGLDVASSWVAAGVLVLDIRKQRGYQAREIAKTLFERSGDVPLPLIIVLEQGLVAKDNLQELVWATLANIDPERDLIFDEKPVTDASGRTRIVRHPRRVVIDATTKDARDGFARDWPDKQVYPNAVIERVNGLLAKAGVKA
ncbi:MAG: menaquinone biosynthesis decarboxylase [Planctomycetes bacterium]|nr:menaquinone biosynthesis decarboxylase [Planctomycetota bacterium]